MTRKQSKRILSVKVKQMFDDSPDTSWLGEFSDSAKTEFAINHRERNGGNTREFEWFNAASVDTQNNTSEDNAKYAEQDYKRMMQLNNGHFCFIGIWADAEIGLPRGDSYLCQSVTSGGLWGIESDSDKSYFAEVEQEQLAELRGVLADFGFPKRAIARAIAAVEHVDL